MSDLKPCPFCGKTPVQVGPDEWVKCADIGCAGSVILARPERWNTRTSPAVTDEQREILRCAADALDIAADWHVENVQVSPPPSWNLPAYGEDTADGWCSTSALAAKLRELSAAMGVSDE